MRLPSHNSLTRDVSMAMTPMIDVVFLLLIYFLCTASFQKPEQLLPTTLPPTGSATYRPPPEVQELGMIQVQLRQPAAGLLISLNGRPCPSLTILRQRLQALAAADSSLPVVLDIAPEVRIGSMVRVYDTCLVAGLRRINFAASAATVPGSQ